MVAMTADAPGPTNLQEFTVSELSVALKREINMALGSELVEEKLYACQADSTVPSIT